MNIGTLIALAAKKAFDENEQQMGVRLSPVTLTAAELVAAVKEVRARLGPSVYVVGSAPSVAATEIDPRAYVAPDQRAAERATLWRNKVKVANKERLVYVSVGVHPKANGLRDCLQQIRERDLRDAFLHWAAAPKSGLPAGLADSLKDADLLGSVRLAALCEFAASVAGAEVKGAAAWRAVGDALPLINLVSDSKLGKDDTADRLRANHAIVRAVETGEGRRRATSGPLAPVEELLQAALANPPKGGPRAALASVDLGEVKTTHLAKSKGAKAKPGPAEGKLGGVGAKAGGKAAPPKPTSKTAKVGPPQPGVGAVPDATTPSKDSPLEQVLTSEPGSSKGSTKGPQSKLTPRSVRLVGAPLPRSLAAMLTTLLEGAGDPVELTVKGADRSHLKDLAKTVSPEPREAARVRAKLTAAHAAWAEARRGVIDAARALPAAPPVAEMFTRGLPSLLKEPTLEAPIATLVTATIALYDAAGESDERTMREVLALDTIALRGRDADVALRVVGPLHLLSIGQALVARRALDDAKDLPENARRLIARSMEVAPAAPGMFSDESGELLLARGVAGLLVYERVPEVVSAGDASAIARSVVLRYLALCPHALLGLRVAVTGDGDLTALVEGVASAAMEASPAPERVEVLCVRPPSYESRSQIAVALGQGTLRLGAIDEQAARGAHLTLRFAGTRGRPEDEEAAAPAVKTFSPPGGGRTTFDLRERGLRVRTSVRGARALEAVEALAARALGKVPQGAFVTEVVGRSLRAECEGATADGGWLAIVGQSLGRRPPAPWFLIAHEAFGARATCAVVAKDVRPAARSVQEGLVTLGVSELRPRPLLLLAEKLASAGRSSLVPLARPAASLVASGLLALELRKALGGDVDALIAPLTGAVYETLIGHAEEGQADAMQIGAARTSGGVRLLIGYATVSAAPEIDTSKAQFDGAVAKRIARVAEALQMGADGARADAAAAREALSWALWSAAAADDSTHGTWRDALTNWSGAVSAPVEALVLVRSSAGNAKELVGKVGRVKTVLRPLAVDRLNALLLG